jgi:hypothetical protein
MKLLSIFLFLKRISRCIGFLAVALACAGSAAETLNGYTDQMFRRAMKQANLVSDAYNAYITNTPLYVLISLKDPKTDRTTDVCVLSSYLTGAIQTEHHLWDDPHGQRKAFDIAMSTPNRVFTFKNRKALGNASRVYTAQQLAMVRQLLQGKSREELQRAARVNPLRLPNEQSALTKIYRHDTPKGFWSSDRLRVAVAHVLLEHGILVGEAQELNTLYVDDGK